MTPATLSASRLDVTGFGDSPLCVVGGTGFDANKLGVHIVEEACVTVDNEASSSHHAVCRRVVARNISYKRAYIFLQFSL